MSPSVFVPCQSGTTHSAVVVVSNGTVVVVVDTGEVASGVVTSIQDNTRFGSLQVQPDSSSHLHFIVTVSLSSATNPSAQTIGHSPAGLSGFGKLHLRSNFGSSGNFN